MKKQKEKKIPDARYTVSREFCGESSRRWVARFCGDWLGKGESKKDAVRVARDHRARFLKFYR